MSHSHMDDIPPITPGKGMTELFLENMFIIMMRPVSVMEPKLQNVSVDVVERIQELYMVRKIRKNIHIQKRTAKYYLMEEKYIIVNLRGKSFLGDL